MVNIRNRWQIEALSVKYAEFPRTPRLQSWEVQDYARAHLSVQAQKELANAIEELVTLLDWNNTKNHDWSYKTQAMPIGNKQDERYVKRVVLSPTLQFVKENVVR